MRLPGPRLDIGQSLVGYTLQFNDESLWEIYPQQEMSFAGYRTVPRLDIPCSSITLYSLFIDLDIFVSQSLVMFVMFICLLRLSTYPWLYIWRTSRCCYGLLRTLASSFTFLL